MTIQFHCQNCGKHLQVPDDALGRRARCPHCEHVNVVPEGEPEYATSDSTYPLSDAGGGAAPTGGPAENPYAASATAATVKPYFQPARAPVIPRSVLAGRGARLLARIVDAFLVTGALIPGGIMVLVFAIRLDSQRNPDPFDTVMVVIGVVLTAGGALLVVLINWVLISKDGQTLGKKALGVRIVNSHDGSLPGFVHGVILRNWIPIAINQACGVFWIVDALFILGDERQCVHDLIASTKVIDARARISQ